MQQCIVYVKCIAQLITTKYPGLMRHMIKQTKDSTTCPVVYHLHSNTTLKFVSFLGVPTRVLCTYNTEHHSKYHTTGKVQVKSIQKMGREKNYSKTLETYEVKECTPNTNKARQHCTHAGEKIKNGRCEQTQSSILQVPVY